MPQKRAAIHDEWISAISEPRKASINSLQKRQESIESRIEDIALPEGYVQAKQDLLEVQEEQAKLYRDGLEQSHKGGTIARADYEKAVAQVTVHRLAIGRERIALKKSRRTISGDIADIMPSRDSIAESYAEVVSRCVWKPFKDDMRSAKKKKDREEFRQRAYSTYECRRLAIPEEEKGPKQYWCPISQDWYTGASTANAPIKIAHIVPREFLKFPHQTMKLFDEDTASLEVNPRNALPMCAALEEAFDSYKLVIVPIRIQPNEIGVPTEYKCVLVDKGLAKWGFTAANRKYSEIDGVQLKFLNNSRPAARYLYLRYCCAYIYWRQEGNTAWAEDLPSKKYLWATPGEYLRRSMLKCLAITSGDLYLPPPFYVTNTFDDEKESEITDDDKAELAHTFSGEVVRMFRMTGRLKEGEDKASDKDDSDKDEDRDAEASELEED